MWEIIADPKDYGIEDLVNGLGSNPMPLDSADREKWAEEIGVFAQKLLGLADKATELKGLFSSEDIVEASPAALKTFKVQLFKINAALQTAIDLARQLESQIVEKA